MENFIQLTPTTIGNEHICCAISDKKCTEGYQAKKGWLTKEFANGYVFRRIDARAKVFIEYGPAEYAWLPIEAPNYLNINCFWVSGKYKKQGYGKQLLQSAIDDAKKQNRTGLVTVTGTKKYHFMSDSRWLLKQGFQEVDSTPDGFSLLCLNLDESKRAPTFKPCAQSGGCPDKEGIAVYYSNRCPFTEFHTRASLAETAEKRGLNAKVIKLATMEEAQNAPSPATIFSMFYNGQFVTTDISACMDSRFDKVLEKALGESF